MIENGHLVHGQIDSSLQSWQPESFFITGVLLAVLATILSFQSTSLTYDMFLGIKPKGEATAPDMHMLLLADEGSPLSVAAAVFRNDELDRARFYGDIPKTTKIVRHRAGTARSILVKLFLMLLAAPLINLIAVFLSLEFNEDVTFSEAGFDPVAFGFDRHKNLTVDKDEYVAKCDRFRTSFSHAADEHAQFFFCQSTTVEIDLEEPAQATELILRALPNGQLEGSLKAATVSKVPMVTVHLDLFTGDEVYRIAQAFTQDDLQDLVNEMALFLEHRCPTQAQVTEITPTKSEPTVTEITPLETETVRNISHAVRMEQTPARIPRGPNVPRQNIFTASQTFKCPMFETLVGGGGLNGAGLGFAIFNANITFVGSDTFRVVNTRDLPIDGSEPTWFDGSNLTLLKRRRNYVPVGILFICVGVLLIVRLLVECISNNDIYDGVDEVVARNVGLSNSYAMIRSDRLMRYDHKYQRGLAAHYGTPRPGIPEVREFKGGSVGIGEAEDPEDSHGQFDPTKYYGEEVMNPTLLD